MTESKIIIPDKWHPTNDWDSHRPLLFLAAYHAKGTIVELGCGYGSTKLLYEYWSDHPDSHEFVSLETNGGYQKEFEGTYLVETYDDAAEYMPCGLLFIDCAPGEIRKDLIEKHASDADIIVVHDTEPGAEYVYHMAEALSKFKYRCDLKIEGAPMTTAVSNVVDVSKWKGIYNDKFNVQ